MVPCFNPLKVIFLLKMFPKFLNTGPLISSYLPRANTKEKACQTIIFLESHLGVSISHHANEETDLSWRQTLFKY